MDWFDDIRLNKIQRHMHLLWNGKDLKNVYDSIVKNHAETHTTHTHTSICFTLKHFNEYDNQIFQIPV